MIFVSEFFGSGYKPLFATYVNITRTFPNTDIYLCIPILAFIKPNMKIDIVKRMGEGG